MRLLQIQINVFLFLALLLSLNTKAKAATIYSDNFNDDNADGWTVVNDTTKASKWQVIGGVYNQLNIVSGFTQSFHKGSYSYYRDGLALTNYEVTVDVTPLDRGSFGIMFRYKNNNNYYRFSFSRTDGFCRLEKKVSGKFTTLVSNGRGPALNQVHKVKIDVEGTKILVYLDNEPLFSASDASISSGTVALFAQRSARFDNVLIETNSSTPKVVITRPTSYFVKTSNTLSDVSAVARNVPAGGGVKFILDNGVSSFTDFTEPYSGQFSNLSQGDHTVKAVIVDNGGNPISDPMALDEDTNQAVGALGKYLVAIGDSITNGVGDDFAADNESVDGRNLSWGYTPILNDLLSAQLSKPVIIVNEAIPGTKSGSNGGNGVIVVSSTKDRHTESRQWLILYGTNDSGGTTPVPSGIDCTEEQLQAGDPSCTGTYKDNMRSIIKQLNGFNKVPILAKVLYVKNATVSRDRLIQEYNIVIDQLVTEHNIGVTPPDFYTYFKNHPGEYADNDHLHPNGDGYISMANLWLDALISSGILNQ